MKAIILLSALVIVASVAYAVTIMIVLLDWQDRAAFGDMFGAPAAVFSALAFVAVAYTLLLQLRQLRVQESAARATERQVQSQESDAQQTRALLERTARLNALSILAETYREALAWIERESREQGVDKSGAMAEVSRLNKTVITEIEQMCGIERGLYAP